MRPLSYPDQTAGQFRKEVRLPAEEIEEREYISPAFGIAKKDGTSMRLVFDLRKLNAILQRKEHYLSTIDKFISQVGGFVFASVVDLNIMGYLSIPLNEAAHKLFTIVFLFGYFECLILQQGVNPATDIFQARTVGIF